VNYLFQVFHAYPIALKRVPGQSLRSPQNSQHILNNNNIMAYSIRGKLFQKLVYHHFLSLLIIYLDYLSLLDNMIILTGILTSNINLTVQL